MVTAWEEQCLERVWPELSRLATYVVGRGASKGLVDMTGHRAVVMGKRESRHTCVVTEDDVGLTDVKSWQQSE